MERLRIGAIFGISGTPRTGGRLCAVEAILT